MSFRSYKRWLYSDPSKPNEPAQEKLFPVEVIAEVVPFHVGDGMTVTPHPEDEGTEISEETYNLWRNWLLSEKQRPA